MKIVLPILEKCTVSVRFVIVLRVDKSQKTKKIAEHHFDYVYTLIKEDMRSSYVAGVQLFADTILIVYITTGLEYVYVWLTHAQWWGNTD